MEEEYEEEEAEETEFEINLLKPVEIKAFLDEYVIGQEEAKKVLAVSVYNHYKRFIADIHTSRAGDHFFHLVLCLVAKRTPDVIRTLSTLMKLIRSPKKARMCQLPGMYQGKASSRHASSSSPSRETLIGTRPTNSGISPNLTRS